MKSKLKSITITFSESPDIQEGISFFSFKEAQAYLDSIKKPDLGYYKTDCKCLWENGFEWTARYDIGAEDHDLSGHIENFWKAYSLSEKPSWMSENRWARFCSQHQENSKHLIPYLENCDLSI